MEEFNKTIKLNVTLNKEGFEISVFSEKELNSLDKAIINQALDSVSGRLFKDPTGFTLLNYDPERNHRRKILATPRPS